MLPGPRTLFDLKADAEMIGPDSTRVEQTPQEQVLRSSDCVKRAGAVEGVGELHVLDQPSAAFAELDGEAFRFVARGDYPPGDNLETSPTNQSGNGSGNLRSDPVPVHVPPGARVAEESPLLLER